MSDEPATFVNAIEVDAADLDALLDALRDGLDRVVRHRPGFVSAELLVDATGTRVLNVARWRRAADAAATREDPEAARSAARVAALATAVEPGIFHLVHAVG